MNLESYHFIAYKVETSKLVLDWPDVGSRRRFLAGEVIVEGNVGWRVVGVRNTSTEQLGIFDVEEVTIL